MGNKMLVMADHPASRPVDIALQVIGKLVAYALTTEYLSDPLRRNTERQCNISARQASLR